MHQSSMDKMKLFKETHLADKVDESLEIMDLGSTEIGGCYRDIFAGTNWNYTGVDLAPGKNVDLVLSDSYNWLEIASGSVDVFVSGQTFEHIEYFWKTMLEIGRVLKPGGLCCIIAPSRGPEHRYPVDCWRIYPDGFTALARYAGLKVIDVTTQWDEKGYVDGSDMWGDTMLVASKPRGYEKKLSDSNHIYKYKIDANTEGTYSRIIKYLHRDMEVLELGPATGYFTQYMSERLGCTVDCVEISPEMAAEAEQYCRTMLVANLDEINLTDRFEQKKYDCVLLADVLEHTVNNASILMGCRKLLKNNGRLILSIPNIAHASVIGSLLKGRFNYQDEGLLDRTHLRFFTRESITELLEQCNFAIETIDCVEKLPEDTEFKDSLVDLPMHMQKTLLDGKDALTYQYVIVCSPSDAVGEAKPEYRSSGQSALDMRRAFTDGLNRRISYLEDLNLKKDRENSVAHKEYNNKLKEYENKLSDTQRLALERLNHLEILDKGLGVAQKLALERMDKITELESSIEKLRCAGMELNKIKNSRTYKLLKFIITKLKTAR